MFKFKKAAPALLINFLGGCTPFNFQRLISEGVMAHVTPLCLNDYNEHFYTQPAQVNVTYLWILFDSIYVYF